MIATNTSRRWTYALVFGLLLGAAAPRAAAQTTPFDHPESLVRSLYAAVSFGPGSAADWNHVREFFLPEAVFAMRRTPTDMAVIGLDEFIQWFVDDVERMNMVERGFEENVQRLELTVFGDMAHAFVVYRARFKTPADLPGQYGLDSFGLVRMNGRWWIASVTNDIVTRNRPLPPELAVSTTGG